MVQQYKRVVTISVKGRDVFDIINWSGRVEKSSN